MFIAKYGVKGGHSRPLPTGSRQIELAIALLESAGPGPVLEPSLQPCVRCLVTKVTMTGTEEFIVFR